MHIGTLRAMTVVLILWIVKLNAIFNTKCANRTSNEPGKRKEFFEYTTSAQSFIVFAHLFNIIKMQREIKTIEKQVTAAWKIRNRGIHS